jgi:heat shock protein HtpX
LFASSRRIAAQATSWAAQHVPELSLLLPIGLYLAVTLGLLIGSGGVLAALALTLALGLLGPRVPADTLLSLYRAEPIAPGQGTVLRAAIETLSRRAGLPVAPALAIIPSTAIGAFSCGTSPRLALLMTEGLMRRYSLREIVTIAAHEIAHMRAGDLPVFALADCATRLAQILAYLGVVLLVVDVLAWTVNEDVTALLPVMMLMVAPALNSQLQLLLPRDIEYAADRTATALTGDMATMLAVLHSSTDDIGSPLDDFRLPVPQRRDPNPSPLRAHVSGAERADRLRSAPPADPLPSLALSDEPLVSLVGVGPIEMRPRNRWPGVWF